MIHPPFEDRNVRTARLRAWLHGAFVTLLLGCSAEHDAGYQATCTPMYQLSGGVRGAALNQLYPGDGGRYCVENLETMDCVGNYCRLGEGTTWTR
jgi:hypothetical protein